MDYLSVPNWDKYQHRDFKGKKNMPWFRVEATLFDDPAIADLSAYEFRAFMRALTLAARTGNELPASANWLRAHFGRSWFPVCSRLVSLSLLDGTVPPQKALENKVSARAVVAVLPLLEEKRGEEKDLTRAVEIGHSKAPLWKTLWKASHAG